jgi:hypothetical protein
MFQNMNGVRLSLSDVFVIVLGIVTSVFLKKHNIELWWIVPVVLIHFFLFCNVFLLWRRWELIWAAFFVLNVGTHLYLKKTGLVTPLLIQAPITLYFIIRQINSPFYKGLGSKKTQQ